MDFDIELGLALGNLLSATKARTGHYGSLDDCKKTLEIPLSPAGLGFVEKLSGAKLPRSCYLVPSRYMKNPVSTIGLGDCFVAGMQICFIR